MALVAAALAQSESQIESDEVKRVGAHIACQCGSCTENINCNMSSGQCHFCKPARTKIYKMQQTGMSDDNIVAAFIKEYGQGIFRRDPSSFFWLVPYLSLALGAFLVWMILRKMLGGRPLTPAAVGPKIDNDPVLARYRDRIEKDTEKLD